MYGQIATLAFIGVEARPVEVQVRITPGAQSDDLELPGEGLDDLERLAADAACRPQDDEPLHRQASSRSRT